MTKIQKDYKDYKRHVWDGKMANIKETRRGKSKEILKRANERNTSEWNCLVLSWLLGSFLYVEKKITTRARLCCRNGFCLMRHEANTNNYKDWIICLSCLQHGLIFQRGPWCTGDTWEAITTALTSNNNKEMNGWTDSVTFSHSCKSNCNCSAKLKNGFNIRYFLFSNPTNEYHSRTHIKCYLNSIWIDSSFLKTQ